ncbi:MAG: aldo/keto reductase [Chloroflexi bacterium]|nr:aldo/keto reductase [Chloroflexota bacterium]
MQTRPFGVLGEISALTLGGGGVGQVWGQTTREESVATVQEAVAAGVTFLDMAPLYGNGEAEIVVGEAFGGHLPEGVRVSTKCLLGNPHEDTVHGTLESSLVESLRRMRLEMVDVFFLHGQIIPDGAEDRYQGTTRRTFVNAVRPAFERLKGKGLIREWGITGIGIPSAVLETLREESPPSAVQAVANLLDSPGAMKRYSEPAQPRDIISAANQFGVAVMGIRAVQAGALTSKIDRALPDDHPEMVDYQRAAPFRALAKEMGESPASLAHRYALSMRGISTVILGVKNRAELRECIQAEAEGRLEEDLVKMIDKVSGQ